MGIRATLRRIIGERWSRFGVFLAVIGPGIITANVDNDAGGLATYSQAGAHFGLSVLWIFIPVTVLLIMVQEMVNRMGVVSGQGLSDMIRERFGVKITFYLMLLVLLTNFGNVMAEFAGIASAGALFGLPSWTTVPVCAMLVWLLALRGSYHSVEKIFLFACVFYLAYPITFVMLKPDLSVLTTAMVSPRLDVSPAYLVMMSASSAPPSPHGCSSISSHRSRRRTLTSRTMPCPARTR
jgi:NRAMP (natural resistance-associated macrophage protein)-like metal ion transporter